MRKIEVDVTAVKWRVNYVVKVNCAFYLLLAPFSNVVFHVAAWIAYLLFGLVRTVSSSFPHFSYWIVRMYWVGNQVRSYFTVDLAYEIRPDLVSNLMFLNVGDEQEMAKQIQSLNEARFTWWSLTKNLNVTLP